MSFYTEIKTELSSKPLVISALEELKRRGEISSLQLLEKKGKIKIDRDGDIILISQTTEGMMQVEGDSRVVNAFANRLKQMYAYESIKQSLPLDFEIAEESELAGNISIVLKG